MTTAKLTVNLCPEALEALNIAAERTGMTRTDTLNKALVMFEMTSRPVPVGKTAAITDQDDPSMVLLKSSAECCRACAKAGRVHAADCIAYHRSQQMRILGWFPWIAAAIGLAMLAGLAISLAVTA